MFHFLKLVYHIIFMLFFFFTLQNFLQVFFLQNYENEIHQNQKLVSHRACTQGATGYVI
ncbi:hypothetical protein LEP1GSC193_2847 [Leptospira alstonii serovar Pingchang str. 80-412]|uniref:Uncharacterized protein n=2 Tax=Leptospira alstonii TaxID=28452 RepID=M6CRW2_9LEPT|nr:hypothetical protein LEP1GSC194_1128 [Leptospira alstonii serovar Sichuan str. 79601]EQA78876.1 hypothetical protein LEP1GSC193_2847 [Leptospira alstonii serovar Pingchang str. 80-412]